MPSVVDTLLSELARSQQRQAYISSSGAGIQAGTEAFQVQKGQEDIGQQQLKEGLKGSKAGRRQQTRGLVGGGIGWLVGQVLKKALQASFAATPTGLPATLLSLMPAVLTYLGSRRGAKGADYKYEDIQVPEDISKGMFLQPERSQIAQDIRKIDIQGETMEDIHKAAGQSLALKLGATALPMGDILKSFAPAKAVTDVPLTELQGVKDLMSQLYQQSSTSPAGHLRKYGRIAPFDVFGEMKYLPKFDYSLITG